MPESPRYRAKIQCNSPLNYKARTTNSGQIDVLRYVLGDAGVARQCPVTSGTMASQSENCNLAATIGQPDAGQMDRTSCDLSGCLFGSEVNARPAPCGLLDMDDDGEIDLFDFAEFQLLIRDVEFPLADMDRQKKSPGSDRTGACRLMSGVERRVLVDATASDAAGTQRNLSDRYRHRHPSPQDDNKGC